MPATGSTRPMWARFLRLGVAVLPLAGLAGGCLPWLGGHPGGQGAGRASPGTPTAPLSLAITPATGATNLPISTEIGIRLSGGRITRVSVTRVGGTGAVAGSLREDASSWVPAAPLAFGASYLATVSARGADGVASLTKTVRFATMRPPSRTTGTGLYLFSGQTYGVAMPIVIQFDPPVPTSARAGIQRRLFVTSNPPQPGVWSWTSGGQVFYRPPRYWQPGTTLSVRSALGGLPMGGGSYGDVDRSARVRIGAKLLLEVNNSTKRMRVYAQDRLIRTIPVSLGKPSTPSSSGHLVIMTKEYATIFDTTREGPGGYRVQVAYAMRLTWGGEFIHAAPWSVGDQGRRNVSHGCVNLSTSAAAWLFTVTHVGDPVLVRGTEVAVSDGNGWTAWNLTWPQYIRGSALPVPSGLASATAVDPAAASGTRPGR